MLEEDDFEDEAPLVRGRGSRDQTIVDQEVEEMLDRAETAGAPPEFMTDERVAVYNHHDVWRVELGADPPAAVLAMEVRLTNPEATPRRSFRARPLAPLQKEFLDRHVEVLLETGVLEHSQSSYVSPVVLARKPDDSWRMYINLRHVNSLTCPMKFPLPRINELLMNLGGARVFIASFDLMKGFWQFPLHPNSKHLLAFATHRGRYQFTRVVM